MFWQNAFRIVIGTVVCGTAYAQDYPYKPMRLVVPWPAGGVTDVVARIVGERLGQALGKPMVIDNKAGASGFIGTELVAKAAPDGYTLLMVTSSTHAASPALYRKIPYDPVKDFSAVSQVTFAPNIVVVTPSLAVTSVADLVTLAKAKPGHLNYASYGNGSTAHLATELLMQVTGTTMTHITYKGAAPAVMDLMAGQVQVFIDPIPSSLPHVRSGKLRGLAVTGTARVAAAPELPAVAETYPGYEVTVWQGLQLPAGAPRAIVDKLNAQILKIMALPDVRERLLNLGGLAVSTTPEQFTQHIERERKKWTEVVRRAGIPLVDQ